MTPICRLICNAPCVSHPLVYHGVHRMATKKAIELSVELRTISEKRSSTQQHLKVRISFISTGYVKSMIFHILTVCLYVPTILAIVVAPLEDLIVTSGCSISIVFRVQLYIAIVACGHHHN